jgi:DNA-binding SARP family transcriptional activator
VVESRAQALLDRGGRGDLDGLVAELEALTAAHPLRERLWATRMLALYRSGRQADALGAYGAAPAGSSDARAPSETAHQVRGDPGRRAHRLSGRWTRRP